MRLTHEQLLFFKQVARQEFLAIGQGERLKEGKDLSHGDRIALAFFRAGLACLGKWGVQPDGCLVEMEVPDSDPVVDEQGWIYEPEED